MERYGISRNLIYQENFLEEMMFDYRLLSQKWEQKNEKGIAGKGKESRNEK